MNYSQAAKRKGDHKDCAVRAASIVTNTEYEVVWTMMNRAGRRTGKGTPNHITRRVISHLGYWLDDCTSMYRKKAKTVCTIERVLPKTGTYIIWVSGHVLAYKDGKIQDWSRGRRHRIIRVEKVKKRV